eukprot:6532938-Ditylum_brightwellii.AAC.1
MLYKTVTERGDSYEEFVKKLIVAGWLGLEQYIALDYIEEYMVGYFCNGSSSSAEWDKMLCLVVEKMVNGGKGDKNVFSVIGSMMNTFIKSKYVSRDEVSYMLGGGLFKRI